MSETPRPELLAPAGTLEAVTGVLDAGADAVYVSGKALNMRQHRASYNFDDDALAAAIATAHERGRRLYVTLNSLIFSDQLDLLRRTLETVGRLEPDALIVQDLAVASLAREICVHVPLHASTMMNVHHPATAEVLALLGFTRIIASRDIPLARIAEIGRVSGLETECFVHGDLCIAQGAQCYLSGLTFGESSNCGRCMKPCRWDWRLQVPGEPALDGPAEGYLLARRDLCLLEHLPALVEAGITSLKIEGRMRSAAFLTPLVSLYRRELDHLLADPAAYRPTPEALAEVQQRRVRDYTTGQTFGRPGLDGINPTGAREPRFFSTAGPRLRLTTEWVPAPPAGVAAPLLVAHVTSPATARAALDAGADALLLNGDGLIGYGPAPDQALIDAVTALCTDAERHLTVRLPVITDSEDLALWDPLLASLAERDAVAVAVSNLGALQRARDAGLTDIRADVGLNAANPVALDELSTLGCTRATAAIELHAGRLLDLLDRARLPLDLIVQGPLPAMLLEHCVPGTATGDRAVPCGTRPCRRGPLKLIDRHGACYPLVCDRRCRNHLYTAADLCLLPHLGPLLAHRPAALRLEAVLDDPATVATVVAIYRRGVDALVTGAAPDVAADLDALVAATGRPLMDGPLRWRRHPSSPPPAAGVSRHA